MLPHLAEFLRIQLRRLSREGFLQRSISPLAILGSLLLAGSLGCTSLPPVEEVASQHPSRRETAIQDFEEAGKKAQYEAALARWHQGDEEGSLAELRLLVQRDPQWRPAQQLLAQVLIARDESVEAEKILRQLLEQETTWQDSLSLALLLDTEGRESEAAFYTAQAKKLAPDDASTTEVIAKLAPDDSFRGDVVLASYSSELPSELRNVASESWSQWARTASGRQKLEEASEALAMSNTQSAVRLILAAIYDEPQNRDIPHKTAAALIRSHQSGFATEILEPSLAHHPYDAALFRLYGAALIELGRPSEAQTALSLSLSLDNRSALTYFLLAESVESAGDAVAAAPLYERAAQLDPRFKEHR